MIRRWGPVAMIGVIACCSRSEVKDGGKADGPAGPLKPTLTVFALAEVRGQIGPCGCTSDPLGDLSRTAQVIADARAAGPVLVVDAGSLLYSKSPVPPQQAAQEELKADFLARTYQGPLGVAATGLGPADLAQGPERVRFPRQAVNVTSKVPLDPPKVVTVGGAKVGVFGVIAADAVPGLAISDPVAAGKRAAADLRGQGARVVIALVQAGSKRDAAELVRQIGDIDLAVAGLGLAAPEPDRIETEAQPIAGGWLVVPANRGQVVSRVELTLRDPSSKLVDAIGAGAAAVRIAALDKRLAALDADLAKFAKDPTADPAFVAEQKQERGLAAAGKAQLEAQPLHPPAKGSYFTFEQVVIRKTLACSTEVQDGVRAYDLAAGKANVAAAASVAVPPPPKGAPGYAGLEACSDCHQEAVDFWKQTVHASAWKTLEDRGQQFDFECIGCHVTGWDRPGGANLGHNDSLRDVQCETCHGPGSIHIAKGGKEKPFAVARAPAADLCATQCHTKEHSDTFQYEAYLRDVTGPGHGEKRRKALGDGPTGHSLRTAALAKAGSSLGARCTR